jgi:hypothetical protein
MSPEVALLNEVWEVVKQQLNKKDRVQVAEDILRCFQDNVDMSDLDLYKNEFDSPMKTAILSLNDEWDDLEEDDEEDWDY